MLVCIDEVQIAYHQERTRSADFWNLLKGLQGGPGILKAEHDARVIMAAAYGTRCSGADLSSRSLPLAPLSTLSSRTWW